VIGILPALAMAADGTVPESGDLRARGFEVLEQIRREYYLPKSKLYCESIDVTGKKSGPSFNWPAGVMLSALNAAARLDPKYKPWLREYADATRAYWNDKGPVPGYDVLPGPKAADRYYDDNAWMVLALVETYEVLGDRKYLDWASDALDFVLSGEDSKLGGGIYWRESDRLSKNACSNAPSAAACLALAKYRRAPELIAKAEALLSWTRKTLQDPSDGLIWDNVGLTGKVDRTKWSYNTGLFLRASAMLGKASAEGKVERGRIVSSSVLRWFDPVSGSAKDTGRFAHLWLEGLAATAQSDLEVQAIRRRVLDFVWSHVRDDQGRLGDMWDRRFDPKRTKFELIDQASVARSLLFEKHGSPPQKL
jgi:hypothetical protein